MHINRSSHASSTLSDGKVLVTGGIFNREKKTASAELYDPSTGNWTRVRDMNVIRFAHISSLLPNGKVLITGGTQDYYSALVYAELYDPITDNWTMTDSMSQGRFMHTVSVLPNGKVLVTGGGTMTQDNVIQPLDTCELYDPMTGKWSMTSSMNTARAYHTATVLPNGKVLIVGCESEYGTTPELYDPITGNWTPTADIDIAQVMHTATLLMNGQVLVAGGEAYSFNYNDSFISQLYDPSTNTWAKTGSIHYFRYIATAFLLPNGKVLIAYGQTDSSQSSELYDPITGNWTNASDYVMDLFYHAASMLKNGNVLVSGGMSSDVTPLKTSMLYNSSLEIFISYNNINDKQLH
jgi:N-acetylneuraminic acid mutarotase